MDSWLVQLIGLQMLFVGFLIWLVVHYRSKRSLRRSEERVRLIDRFESREALEHFLGSEPGRRYVERTGGWRIEPRWLILYCVVGGAISFAVGLGLLLLVSGSNDYGEMAVPGAVFSGLGVGLFIAAGLSWMLVRVWRLDSDRHE